MWTGPLDSRASFGTAVAERAEGVNDGKASEDSPEEEAKGNGGLGATADIVATAVDARAVANGEGDTTSEPEEHGKGVKGEGDELVEEAAGNERDDADVDEDEDRPD